MERIERIVLHVPHASPVFPFGMSGWDEGIAAEVARWTDWYTDWLFSSSTRLDGRIVPVAYPFSRFFCDAERLEDDPLELVGQGIVYERFNGLCRKVSVEEREFAIMSYAEHRDRLRRALINERTLLVDCHSFPTDLSDVEICVGVNEDWSRPKDALLEKVLSHFRKEGYRTEVNNPYSNSVSPETGFPYRSVMIEVNKRCYLTTDGELNTDRALVMRRCIESWLLSMLDRDGNS